MSNTTRKLISEKILFGPKEDDLTVTNEIIAGTRPKNMFKEIRDDINERLSKYTDSRQPTGDEVRLAWLVAEIEELNKRLKSKPIKNSVSINSYPSNYVEEEMPQIIVEVRYKKDYDPSNKFRKKEASTFANKIETFINEIL